MNISLIYYHFYRIYRWAKAKITGIKDSYIVDAASAVEAASSDDNQQVSPVKEQEEDGEEEEGDQKKRVGFRDRKVKIFSVEKIYMHYC